MVAVSGAARTMPVVTHVGDTVIGNGEDSTIKFINDIINFWKETWAESKLMFFLEFVGAICTLIAATMLAFLHIPILWFGLTTKWWVFFFYFISTCCLVRVCYVRHSSWLLLMFMVLTVLNIIGLVNHF